MVYFEVTQKYWQTIGIIVSNLDSSIRIKATIIAIIIILANVAYCCFLALFVYHHHQNEIDKSLNAIALLFGIATMCCQYICLKWNEGKCGALIHNFQMFIDKGKKQVL